MKKILDGMKGMTRTQIGLTILAVVGGLFSGYEVLEHTAPGVLAAVSGPVNVTAEAVVAKPVGEQVGVTFTIEGAYTKPEWKRTLLNSKSDYKDPQNLTVSVLKTVPGFDDYRALKGRTVTVTGAVKDYKGKREIEVTSPSQISLK